MCRGRGFSAIQKVLRNIPDTNLHVHVIWLPMLWKDSRSDAVEGSAELVDSRVRYFWDGDKKTARLFSQTLGLSIPVWDVYLIYDRGAVWKSGPPAPVYWMHQLGRAGGKAPELDADSLTAKVRELLAMPSKDTTRE